MPTKKTNAKWFAAANVAKASTRKSAAKKKTTTTKKPAKKMAAKKPTVVVETKKTTSKSTCEYGGKLMKILLIILLLWNLVFGILNFVKHDSALKLEKMKVGWPENFEKVMELYNSDFYKEQQSAAIQQFMAQ